MAQRLIIDRSACAGHGLCYGTAPELLDCDEQGDPVVIGEAVSQPLLLLARQAVAACPERALALTE
jgi:ferredoxin